MRTYVPFEVVSAAPADLAPPPPPRARATRGSLLSGVERERRDPLLTRRVLSTPPSRGVVAKRGRSRRAAPSRRPRRCSRIGSVCHVCHAISRRLRSALRGRRVRRRAPRAMPSLHGRAPGLRAFGGRVRRTDHLEILAVTRRLCGRVGVAGGGRTWRITTALKPRRRPMPIVRGVEGSADQPNRLPTESSSGVRRTPPQPKSLTSSSGPSSTVPPGSGAPHAPSGRAKSSWSAMPT